jgi:hypothetical protein
MKHPSRKAFNGRVGWPSSPLLFPERVMALMPMLGAAAGREDTGPAGIPILFDDAAKVVPLQ